MNDTEATWAIALTFLRKYNRLQKYLSLFDFHRSIFSCLQAFRKSFRLVGQSNMLFKVHWDQNNWIDRQRKKRKIVQSCHKPSNLKKWTNYNGKNQYQNVNVAFYLTNHLWLNLETMLNKINYRKCFELISVIQFWSTTSVMVTSIKQRRNFNFP